ADPDWPEPLRDALVAYRQAWRAKMDEVNATIAASAEQEELVDQPEVEKGVVRVAGPFTMEAVMPVEHSDDGAEPGFAGEPEADLETFDADDVANAEAFVDKMLRLLAKDGVRFPDNRTLKFSRLDRIEGGLALHGEGEWANGEGGARNVVVSIGPEDGIVRTFRRYWYSGPTRGFPRPCTVLGSGRLPAGDPSRVPRSAFSVDLSDGPTADATVTSP